MAEVLIVQMTVELISCQLCLAN